MAHRSGKVRYIGASSMFAWQLAKAQFAAQKRGFTPFVSMQNHYNLIYREEERGNDSPVLAVVCRVSCVVCRVCVCVCACACVCVCHFTKLTGPPGRVQR
jgi:hypothetical protein